MSAENTVFVKNLPQEFDRTELESLFSKYGRIQRLDIPDQHGKTNTIVYVHYDNSTSAANAIKNLHNYNFKGKPIICEQSKYGMKEKAPVQKQMAQNETNKTIPSRPKPPHEGQPRFEYCYYNSLPVQLLPVSFGDGADGTLKHLKLYMPTAVSAGHNCCITTTVSFNGKDVTPAVLFLMPFADSTNLNMNYNNNTVNPININNSFSNNNTDNNSNKNSTYNQLFEE